MVKAGFKPLKVLQNGESSECRLVASPIFLRQVEA